MAAIHNLYAVSGLISARRMNNKRIHSSTTQMKNQKRRRERELLRRETIAFVAFGGITPLSPLLCDSALDTCRPLWQLKCNENVKWHFVLALYQLRVSMHFPHSHLFADCLWLRDEGREGGAVLVTNATRWFQPPNTRCTCYRLTTATRNYTKFDENKNRTFSFEIDISSVAQHSRECVHCINDIVIDCLQRVHLLFAYTRTRVLHSM